MSNAEIREMFDNNPNLTVKRLALIAGKTVDQIKRILMENN